MTRREFTNLAAGSALGVAYESSAAVPQPKFRHRGYLGWIVDIDSRPEPNAPWPSIRLDRNLVEQYKETFPLMKRLGYNEAVVWGVYVGRRWPVELNKAITPERARLVEEMIESAHANGLKIITGLGVLSWGYEELIQKYPALGPTNPKAMCASNPDAWKWMEKIVDYVLTRLPTDGISMQSADLKRCTCDKCRRWNDDEYHVMINSRTADYIHSRKPKAIVAVSGWGINFNNPASIPLFVDMSKRVDYIIDVVDSAGDKGGTYRRDLISKLHCDFGTIGGPLVEPPLHWDRERWFLPTVRTQGTHLQALAADGGRACEYFNHIRANPGDEITFHVTGRVLSDTGTPWEKHFHSSLEELYGTRGATTDRLGELFLSAEKAYTGRMLQRRGSGDISLEPLVEDFPGPPIYLSTNLSAEGRVAYAEDMRRVQDGFRMIAGDVPDKTRIPKIIHSIDNVQKDLQSIHA